MALACIQAAAGARRQFTLTWAARRAWLVSCQVWWHGAAAIENMPSSAARDWNSAAGPKGAR
jgi:hypothetical protein